MKEREKNGGMSLPWFVEGLRQSSHRQCCVTLDGYAEAQNLNYSITGTTEFIFMNGEV